MSIPKASLLGLPVSLSVSIETTLSFVFSRLKNRESCIVSFINPHAFNIRLADQAYANGLWHFDLVLPDGIGVVKALKWINAIGVERQSFDATSLFHPVLAHLNEHNKSICLVGGLPGVAERALKKMRVTYGDVDFLGALDGYRPYQETIDWVQTRQPDVVLVGIGAPTQESILLRLKQSGFSGLGFTCGGFFDQYASASQYYPKIVDQLELRWLYRLICEPRRLGRRYLVHYQTFVSDVTRVLVANAFGRRNHQSHLWLARRYARSGP